MRQRSQSVALVASACLLVGACASNPTQNAADGRPLVELERIPYRIAVEHVDQSESVGGRVTDAEHTFVWRTESPTKSPTPEDRKRQDELLATFLESLRRHAAANQVGRADTLRAPDLVLRPRLAEMSDFGPGEPYKKFGNAALWLTTWYGGVKTPSKKYETRVALDVDIINPYDGDVVHTFTVTNKSVALNLIERGRVAQSVVVPPWRSIDKPSSVSRAISQRVVENLGALTTGYLKQEFAARQRDILGEAQLIRPRNFAEAGASPVLEARIIAKEMITACDIYVNSSEDAVAIEWPENQFSDQATQREGSVFVLRIPAVQIQLDKPKNRVVVEFRVAGRVTSRTFILFRKAAAQK